MKIELIYDSDCPNAAEARSVLAEALAQAGMKPLWTEWNRSDPSAPEHVRRFGSPTILVDERDVGGFSPEGSANSCRVYRQADGRLMGVPSVADIVLALRKGSSGVSAGTTARGWIRGLAALPAAAVAFLPVGVCPACWPAYVAVLSALGLGFLLHTAYPFLLTVLVVGLAVFALGRRARARRGYGPLAVGAFGGAMLAIGRFAVASAWLAYGGLAVLLAASVWNAWPRRAATTGFCPKCARQEPTS